MAISMDLRVLARKLEKSSDDLLVNAAAKDPNIFDKVAQAVAAASTLLEEVANDLDASQSNEIKPEQLDEIAALASSFYESGNPLLKKQASVLDEILLSIAAPKNAIAESKRVSEDEINKLRAKRRGEAVKELYQDPKEALDKMNLVKEQTDAVKKQVKRYAPLEAPLQTRYAPDMPGVMMTRISDHIYQDLVTGKIYDFKAGYTTVKGNKIPGSSVENQTAALGDQRHGNAMFETRESIMNRMASDEIDFIKQAGDKINIAKQFLKDASEFYPEKKALAIEVVDKYLSNDDMTLSLDLLDGPKKKLMRW
jgi:hypothetical protein